jgi:hypothetical protein
MKVALSLTSITNLLKYKDNWTRKEKIKNIGKRIKERSNKKTVA